MTVLYIMFQRIYTWIFTQSPVSLEMGLVGQLRFHEA